MSETAQHRCVRSGKIVELQARWLEDAREYRTEHECNEQCVNYHEPRNVSHD